MGRPKGSINKNMNKKLTGVQLEFEEAEKLKPEVDMATATEIDELAKDTTELEQIQQELDLARVELEKTRLEIEAKKQELKSVPTGTIKDAPAVAIRDESAKQRISEQKARDSVQVTGKFYNLRVKGQSVKLPYLKYGDEAVKWWPFDHGKIYTIPKGFADQINGGTETDPMYYTPHFIKNEGQIINPDDPETGIHAVDTTDKRYSFVPLNF